MSNFQHPNSNIQTNSNLQITTAKPFGICVLIFLICFEVGCLMLGFQPAFAAGDLPQEKAAPDFILKDLAGKQVQLSSFRGKVVFLNFWATWCPPCRSEMPSIQKLDKLMAGEKFQLLAVSVDKSGVETVKKFVEQGKYTFKVLHDRKGAVSAQYGVRGIPATFIINQTGAIVETAVGSRDWATADFVKKLKGLAQGKSWQ